MRVSAALLARAFHVLRATPATSSEPRHQHGRRAGCAAPRSSAWFAAATATSTSASRSPGTATAERDPCPPYVTSFANTIAASAAVAAATACRDMNQSAREPGGRRPSVQARAPTIDGARPGTHDDRAEHDWRPAVRGQPLRGDRRRGRGSGSPRSLRVAAVDEQLAVDVEPHDATGVAASANRCTRRRLRRRAIRAPSRRGRPRRQHVGRQSSVALHGRADRRAAQSPCGRVVRAEQPVRPGPDDGDGGASDGSRSSSAHRRRASRPRDVTVARALPGPRA